MAVCAQYASSCRAKENSRFTRNTSHIAVAAFDFSMAYRRESDGLLFKRFVVYRGEWCLLVVHVPPAGIFIYIYIYSTCDSLVYRKPQLSIYWTILGEMALNLRFYSIIPVSQVT